MDDFVLNVRQIGNYPEVTSTGANDLLLLQINGLGGAYASIAAADLVSNALIIPRNFNMATNTAIVWPGGNELNFTGTFTFNNTVNIPTINVANATVSGLLTANNIEVNSVLTVGGVAVLTTDVDLGVTSFNGRSGDVLLETADIARAGAAPIINPHFGGWVTAPTSWNPNANDDTVATTAWVQLALCNWYDTAKDIGAIVTSFNGRGGDVTFTADDITLAATATGVFPLTNTPPSGDASKRIANTAFVDDAMAGLQAQLENEFAQIASQLDQQFAPINSPQFTGIPTAPTAAQTVNSGQIATTAFVHAAVTASTTGVSSFNTRTGAVVLTAADVTGAGGAPLASPTFTGVPAAPTATAGTSTTQIATTAFVTAAIAAQPAAVSSFNTRTGSVVLSTADVTGVGGALLASPAFSGTPTAPTAAAASNNTQIATTAYVDHAISVIPAAVSSFNGRTGAVSFQSSDISAVGGALLASPIFTGTPTGPTAPPGTSNQELATTAFVAAAISAGTAGVASFNSRTGAVTLQAADVTGVGGALLSGPTFTGIPAAPTATVGTNTTQLATTAFVQAALAAQTGLVTSFNTRTGSITLTGADVSGAGGALLSSPNFIGVPTSPTATAGTNNTQIATTAFVANAITAAGGVASFNTRTGAVVLTTADVTNAGGAVLASPAFTGVPTGPTAATATSTTQLATTAFVQAVVAGSVTSFGGRTGAVTLQAGDITTAGGALLASPNFTGSPTAPTPTVGTNNTTLATTAFVQAAVATAAGVTSFNTRTGVVTLQAADVTAVGGALLASPAFTGTPTAPTPAAGTNSTQVATTAFVQNAFPLLQNYLGGLTLANNGAQPLSRIDISTGVAASDDNTTMMVLNSVLTKNAMAVWAAGNGNGSLDTGAVAATQTYHVFLIENTTGPVVDVLTSLSPTAPTMPSGYTKKRRIGSILVSNATQLFPFLQVGDEFLIMNSYTWDFFGSPVAASPALTTVTWTLVPAGIRVIAIINAMMTGVQSLQMLPMGSTITSSTWNIGGFSGGTGAGMAGQLRVLTNTSRQVALTAVSAVSTGLFYAQAVGWVDYRGK